MTLAALETKQLKELLNKGWMTHDAIWFYHSIWLISVCVSGKY
jgi:hypothetical protein